VLRTRRGIPRALPAVLDGALLVLSSPAVTRAQIGSAHEQESEQVLPDGISLGGSGSRVRRDPSRENGAMRPKGESAYDSLASFPRNLSQSP
jgi:hypothetical protein